MNYLEGVSNLEEEISKRRTFQTRPYADYEREVRGASGLWEMQELHGKPVSADHKTLAIGMTVYRVDSGYDDYDEISGHIILEDTIENFDYIFNHWMFKLVHAKNTFNAGQLYATRLAATAAAVLLYEAEIEAIRVKIQVLANAASQT